jgi:hypothetical protein
MIRNLVTHLVDSARDLRMALHILPALEKSGRNPFCGKVVDQMQASFTRSIIEGQGDGSPVAITTIYGGPEEL